MGLFDMFRVKPPAASGTPWQKRLAQAERHFSWQDSDQHARAFVRELLTETAPAFGNGKVVDGSQTAPCSTMDIYIESFGGGAVRRSDRNVELHGVYDGRPLRIPISIPGKRVWAIQMACADDGAYFRTLRDPTRVPKARDASDPWESSQPPTDVFVGKGMYLDNCGLGSDFSVSEWGSTPTQARELVLCAMEQLDLQAFELSNTEESVFALGFRPLHALDDVHAYMQACAAFLAEFVKLHGASGSTGGSVAAEAVRAPIKCRYCSSLFYLAPGSTSCSNCGAPATLP
jgi:hypothetical protein